MTEPDYRAMWETACKERDDARCEAEDAVRYIDERHEHHPWSKVPLLWLRKSNPDHVPAVRRVVAYDGGDGLVEDIDVAYLDRAIAIMCDHSESSRRMHRRMWHMSNAECDAATALIQERLASYLRHRDEKAGRR